MEGRTTTIKNPFLTKVATDPKLIASLNKAVVISKAKAQSEKNNYNPLFIAGGVLLAIYFLTKK